MGQSDALFAGGPAHGDNSVLVHVAVGVVAKVVCPGSGEQVIDIGVNELAGGVDLASNDLAQSGETGLAGTGTPDGALDLVILLDEAQLERVGCVINNDDVVKVLADQLDQLFLTVGQVQVAVALIPVIALVQGVVIGHGSYSIAHFAIDQAHHIIRNVSAFAANTGDDDHSGVGELLGVGHHLIGVQRDVGLRQSPVLRPHTNGRTLSLVVGVELGQLLVGLNAGLGQTLEQAGDGIGIIQSAGTGATIAGVGGSPAKDVQLGAGRQGQSAVVLQQNNTFLCDLCAQLVCCGRGLLGDGAAAGNQIQHSGHGAGADQVDDDQHSQNDSHAGLAADQTLEGLGQLHDSDDCDQGDHKHNTKNRELLTAGFQYANDVINVDRKHLLFLLFLNFLLS